MELSSSLASRLYARTQGATQPVEGGAPSTLGSFANTFYDTLQNGERTAIAGLTGRADPHSVVQALAASELAIQTAVSVRDRVVEAYQEILRMPV